MGSYGRIVIAPSVTSTRDAWRSAIFLRAPSAGDCRQAEVLDEGEWGG
jgi:hypothetical protein